MRLAKIRSEHYPDKNAIIGSNRRMTAWIRDKTINSILRPESCSFSRHHPSSSVPAPATSASIASRTHPDALEYIAHRHHIPSGYFCGASHGGVSWCETLVVPGCPTWTAIRIGRIYRTHAARRTHPVVLTPAAQPARTATEFTSMIGWPESHTAGLQRASL